MSADQLVKRLRAAERRPADCRRARCRAVACPTGHARVRRRCVLDRLGARREVSGAPHRGRRRSRRVRDRSCARRDHLLARSRRRRPAADAGLFRFRQCRERRTGVSRAEAYQRGRRRRGVRLRRRRRLSPRGSSLATPRSLRRSSSTPISPCARKCACRPRRISSSSFPPLEPRLTQARSMRRSPPSRAQSRRRISARSRRSTRIAGGSARPMRTAPRATCSSRRRRAGG